MFVSKHGCHLSESDRAKFAMLVSMGEELFKCVKADWCRLPSGHGGSCLARYSTMDIRGICTSCNSQGLRYRRGVMLSVAHSRLGWHSALN